MSEVLQAVMDYVKTPGTDYALLITGPWGCGKTYFWKNAVEPRLQNPEPKETHLRPIYASLYGCRASRKSILSCSSHPIRNSNRNGWIC